MPPVCARTGRPQPSHALAPRPQPCHHQWRNAGVKSRRHAHAPSAASSLSAAAEPSSSSSENNTTNIRIRLAEPSDYWEASDLHCATFFESETPHQRTRRRNLQGPPPGPAPSRRGALAAHEARWGPCALRVDRCVSLQVNDDLQRRGVGRTALLLAEMEVSGEEIEAAVAAADAARLPPAPPLVDGDPLAFPRPLFFLSRLLQPPVRAGLDAALRAGTSSAPATTTTLLVGVATVDSFGDLVPPKALDPGRDGAFGWAPRHGSRNHYAYLSNVAVAPIARRRGVARQLVRAAERLAAGAWNDGGGVVEEEGRGGERPPLAAPPAWACEATALHCSPENVAALELYGGMGYRRVALEPAWAPYLNGRGAGGRCYLMVRRL